MVPTLFPESIDLVTWGGAQTPRPKLFDHDLSRFYSSLLDLRSPKSDWGFKTRRFACVDTVVRLSSANNDSNNSGNRRGALD
jgi:hypothetical protein